MGSAARNVQISRALLDIAGPNHRLTDDALAKLIAAETGQRKRKAQSELAGLKESLLDACAVEVKGLSTSGGEQRFVLAKPGGYLVLLCDNCPSFRTMLWSVVTRPTAGGGWRQHLGTEQNPLQVVLYEDATTPGNAVDGANPRKYSAWYWTVRQFSKWLLSQDFGWFHCMVALTREVNVLDGGKAALCDLVLREFFVHEPLTKGVVIDFGHCKLRLFFGFDSFLGDLDSHRECFGWMAAGSNKYCWKCKNVLRAGANVQSDYFVDTRCGDVRRFDPQSDAEAFHAADTLASLVARSRSNAEVKKAEEVYGLHHVPRGPLLDMELREVLKPVTGSRVDGMHVWFSQGLLQHEVYLFFGDAGRLRPPLKFQDLNRFCNDEAWKFPGYALRPRNFVANLFRDAKITDEGKVRLWASEALVCIPVIRHYAETVVARHPEGNMMQLQIKSLVAMCEAAEAWVSFSKRRVDSKEFYMEKWKLYSRARERAYSGTDPKPKLHFAAHCDGEVDCFPLERKHKLSLLHGTHAVSRDGLKWSKHILARAMLHQISKFLEIGNREQHLEQPVVFCQELTALIGLDAYVSEKAVLEYVSVRRGDVVEVRAR